MLSEQDIVNITKIKEVEEEARSESLEPQGVNEASEKDIYKLSDFTDAAKSRQPM